MQGDVKSEIWDKFVANSPQGSIFCTSNWLKLYDDFRMVGLYKGQELIGIIPLINNSSGFQIPLTPYQGILCENDSLQQRLSEEVATTLKVPLSFHWSFTDIRPFIWNEYKHQVKFTYVVDNQFVLAKLEKDTRYLVKKYQHEGYAVNKEAPENFWEIYCATFERKGLPLPITGAFYRQMTQTIPNDVYICRKDGGITSGAVIIYDNKRGYYILGGSDGGGSSSLTVFIALNEAFSKVREIDMVGANLKDISCYKKGFGGVLTPYYQVYIGR